MRVRTLNDLQKLVDDGHDDDHQQETKTMSETLKFTAANDEKGKDAAEIVHHRARKLCFERRLDPAVFANINATTIEVLQSDRALGQAYKELREACA